MHEANLVMRFGLLLCVCHDAAVPLCHCFHGLQLSVNVGGGGFKVDWGC